MAKLDPALWRDMMAYLRRKHAPICRQWFEDLQPLSMESGLLRIHTSNSVQQNYLQRKCLEQFNEAAQAATGALIGVRFVNDKEPRTTNPHQAAANGPRGGSHGLANGGLALASPASSVSSMSTVVTTTAAVVPPRPLLRPAPLSAPEQGSKSAAIQFDEIVISPDYSFDNFVPGPGNQLAYAAAVAVANQPGTAYNPLFIHGGVGLGKTHLLQAICQTIMQSAPQLRICYLSCDAFMNQFIECVQRGLMNEFRHRYRHVDMLVIDDIHFLANKERSQEEFFHTFNALYQSNRQIVLSSDSPPSEIPQLEERLLSRFQWGLVTHISRPDYETRVAIVRAKAKLRNLDLPDDVVNYIATKIDSNARELEGAITTIQGHAVLQGKPVDFALAQLALGDPMPESRNSQVTLQNIIDVVTIFYNVKLSDLQSKRRHKSITLPRQVCMWLARKRTRFSLQEIGGYFGGRDHTTVMHSIQTIENRIASDPNFAQQMAQLDQRTIKPG